MLRARRFIAGAVLFPGVTFGAQQPEPSVAPKFDVVSIRRVPPHAPVVLRAIDFTPVLPGGQYVDSRAGLFSMIAFAYNITDAANRLVGLPDWTEKEEFAVAAKPAEGFPMLPLAKNAEQVRLMMRSMLTDRFRLRLHTDFRAARVFILVTAKHGIKIKEAEPPAPPGKEGPAEMAMGDSGGRIVGKKVTMAGIANALAVFLKRPVLDRTGLKGFYDLDISWKEDAPDGQSYGSEFGATGAGLLMSALRNQLGLQLRSVTASVKYWIVDHVESPTPN